MSQERVPTPKDRHDIIFSGQIADGKDLEQVKQQLAQRFKMDRARIDQLFTGQPVYVQRDVPYQTALQYQKIFERAGACCSIRPVKKQTARKKVTQSANTEQHRPSPPPGPKKSAPQKPPAGKDARSIINAYRAQVKNRYVLLLAPQIPTETLVLVNKSYAYSFNRHAETALVLLDLASVGYGLLVSDTRIYLHEKPNKPVNFKLSDLQSIEIRDGMLSLNEREVMRVPQEAREDMPGLVKLIRQLASLSKQSGQHAEQKKHEGTPSAPVQSDAHAEDQPPKSGKKLMILAAAGVLLLLGAAVVGYFKLRGASLPQADGIKNLVKNFVRDDRILVNLVSVDRIGEYSAEQNSVPVQVSVSGECEDRVLLKDMELTIAANDEGEWAISYPEHFAFEYQLCPIPDDEIARVLDREIEKELKHVRRIAIKENSGLLIPMNALQLKISIGAPALKEIVIKYKDFYSKKIEGVETNFIYQNFADAKIFLSRDQDGSWNVGGMEALKKVDDGIETSMKNLEKYARSLKR